LKQLSSSGKPGYNNKHGLHCFKPWYADGKSITLWKQATYAAEHERTMTDKAVMNIVRDLIPWEPLFVGSSTGLVGTGLSVLFNVLRGRRVGLFRRVLLSVFALGTLAPWLAVRNFGERLAFSNATNRVDTTTGTPPDLRPRHYAASPQTVSDALVAAVDQLGWDLVYRNETETAFEVEVPVAGLGLFIDDLKVMLSEEDGVTRVDAQSQSRVGRGDLGENRRHVVQLFTVLDQKLER
jgi:uncharacterized protein (DUF1499 family)